MLRDRSSPSVALNGIFSSQQPYVPAGLMVKGPENNCNGEVVYEVPTATYPTLVLVMADVDVS
jgi:hypothetical protein